MGDKFFFVGTCWAASRKRFPGDTAQTSGLAQSCTVCYSFRVAVLTFGTGYSPAATGGYSWGWEATLNPTDEPDDELLAALTERGLLTPTDI